MRILVIGGAGFIGSHTVDALLEKGYEVTILDNLQKRVHPLGKPEWVPEKADFIHGDVRNREDLLRALKNVQVVFYFAAYQDYMPDFSTFFDVNTVGLAQVYELIVEKKFPIRKVLSVSSQAVYGEGKYQCEQHGIVIAEPRSRQQLIEGDWEMHCPFCRGIMKWEFTDETVSNPYTSYALSKSAGESIALCLGKRYEIPSVVLRYSITHGPRNSFFNAYSGICRIFSQRLMHGLPPVIYEDGNQLRDYINIHDVVAANLLVLESDDVNYQIYHVGGGKAISVREFAETLIERFGKSMEPVFTGQFRFGDTRHTISDITKLKMLGWKPERSLRETIDEYIDWIKDKKNVKNYYEEAVKIMKEREVLIQAKTM